VHGGPLLGRLIENQTRDYVAFFHWNPSLKRALLGYQ
jgi:hypothetical protein